MRPNNIEIGIIPLTKDHMDFYMDAPAGVFNEFKLSHHSLDYVARPAGFRVYHLHPSDVHVKHEEELKT